MVGKIALVAPILLAALATCLSSTAGSAQGQANRGLAWMEDFGLSPSNTAAQNDAALSRITATAPRTGLHVGVGRYHFSRTVHWPSGQYPIGQGDQATYFINDGCSDSFVWGDGTHNITGIHPANFAIAPTCSTTMGNGGVGIKWRIVDQRSSIENVAVQPLSGVAGGVGFQFDGVAHSSISNITAAGINGMGVKFGSAGPETENGVVVSVINLFNNADCGLYINTNGTAGMVIQGLSAEQNGGSRGCQVDVEAGFGIRLQGHIEGLPTVASGNAAIIIGKENTGVLADLKVDVSTSDPNSDVGRAFVKIISGALIDVNATSASGAGYNAKSRLYNIGPAASGVTVHSPSPTVPSLNNSSTSRIKYPAEP